MNPIKDIESIIDLYSVLLINKNMTYTKRVGMFNNLIENFFNNIFIGEKDFIFEYKLKFSNTLLMESFLPTRNFNSKKIVEWVTNKLEFQEIFLKEQYTQQSLDDREYYYTNTGKLVQGKKNAPGGIEARYVYPDLYNGQPNDPNAVPKDPKGLPAQIQLGALDQGTQNKKYYESQSLSKEYQKTQGVNISKQVWIDKNVAPQCKTLKDPNGNLTSYIKFNLPANALGKGSKPENNLQYLCHENYCNTYRDQKYDPQKKLCKNNTALSKLKEVGWEGFFEFLREQMNSVAGAAVQVVLDIFGAGVGVQFAWFVLLCWDASRPERNWLNIFVDVVGILTFGTGPTTLMASLKSFGVSLTKLSELEVVSLIVTHKKDLEWVIQLLPTVEGIFKLVTTLGELIIRFFGGPGSEFLINSIKIFKDGLLQFIGKITSETAAVAVEKGVEKLVSKAGGEYVGKPIMNLATGEYSDIYSTGQKVASKTSSVLGKIK